MSYQDSLKPWVIYRRLPNFQRQLIERFRRRPHAEEYLKAIQTLDPDGEFEIVYEMVPTKNDLDEARSLPSYPQRSIYN
ncbi:hypothetical protein ACKFKG_29840 [Phormidesmis sp. 146-35]